MTAQLHSKSNNLFICPHNCRKTSSGITDRSTTEKGVSFLNGMYIIDIKDIHKLNLTNNTIMNFVKFSGTIDRKIPHIFSIGNIISVLTRV